MVKCSIVHLKNIELDLCSNNTTENIIKINPFFSETRGLLDFYSLSYLYFGAMATSSVVLVGMIVSFATGDKIKRHTRTHSEVLF